MSKKKEFRRKQRQRGVAQGELNGYQRMDLMFGEGWGGRKNFPSQEARRAAWFAHKESLTHGWGVRPAGWWDYEAPGQPLLLWEGETEQTGRGFIHDEVESEPCALVRLGVATPEEEQGFREMHETTFGIEYLEENLGDPNLENVLEREPWFKARYEHERKILKKTASCKARRATFFLGARVNPTRGTVPLYF